MCWKGKNNLLTWKWTLHSADTWKLSASPAWITHSPLCRGCPAEVEADSRRTCCSFVRTSKKKIFNTISRATRDFRKLSSYSAILPETEMGKRHVSHLAFFRFLLINTKRSQAELKSNPYTHTHTHKHTHTHTHLSCSLIQSSSAFLVYLCCFHVVLTEREGQETIPRVIRELRQLHQISWIMNNKYLCLCCG